MPNNFLIVILGPTAVGKTALAIEVAKAFGAEIISADSRQFFREMNIGTAKPTEAELKQVKHHFINSLSVTDDYNVGMFERDALNVLETIFLKNKIAVMAGGSGLYINAICSGFDPLPVADKELREEMSQVYRDVGIETLQARLKKLDPEYYNKVDIKNPHRLIRAIEVCIKTGKKYSELLSGGKEQRKFETIKIGLELGRAELYERINKRVDEMMQNGLLEEVKSLAEHKHRNSLHTVGYKELFDFIEGKTDRNRAVELIKQNTRNYAKRQMTWFRKDKTITWFDPAGKEKILPFIKDKINTKS